MLSPERKYNDDEEVDVQYIIDNKPPTNIVREFFRENLASIIDSDEEAFL